MKLNNKIYGIKQKLFLVVMVCYQRDLKDFCLMDGQHTLKSFGVFIWDLNNKKYIDMTSMGIGTSVLGYNNKFINNFVKEKIDRGINTTLNCYEEYELGKELLKIDKFVDQVRFTRGGGEAMSLAIRIARSKSKKQR